MKSAAVGILVSISTEGSVQANIILELRPASQDASVGETVHVGLYAVSDSKSDQSFSAIETIIEWDEAILQLSGIDQSGAVALLSSEFPEDPCNLNESDPPQDGDGLHVASANLGKPVWATPEGVLITTFQFEIVKPACVAFTDVQILPSAGDPECETAVFHGKEPNTNVTGTISGATIVFDPCPVDVNEDGEINVNDLREVILNWGPCPPAPPCCQPDIDRNESVDVNDLRNVILDWGVLCP